MKQNGNWSKDLPSLLVQQVRLQWYKDCRGGNAAVQRNQYPRAMRLPKNFFSYYPFGLPIHFASVVQRPDGFHIEKECRRLIKWKADSTMRLQPFELTQRESGVQVRYQSDIPMIRPGRSSRSLSWHWICPPAIMGGPSAMGGSGTGIPGSGIMRWIF